MRISDWSSDVCSSDLVDVSWSDVLEIEHIDDQDFDVVDKHRLSALNSMGQCLLQYATDLTVGLAQAFSLLQIRAHIDPAVDLDAEMHLGGRRPEERRVGKGVVSPGRFR